MLRRRRALQAYGFLAPFLVFFIVFLLVPVGWVFYSSLRSGTLIGASHFAGLKNWRLLVSDPLAHTALKNTLYFALLAIPGVLILAFLLALVLRNVTRGAPVFRALLYLPTLIPVIVAALIWLFLLHPDFGAINIGLRGLGGHTVNFTAQSNLALPTIAMVEIWRGVGFWALFFLAAIISLPRELYQAAFLDGASALQRFRNLTLPLLWPSIVLAIILATIYNLQVFDSIYVLTSGGPGTSTVTAVWYIYQSLFQFSNLGLGATASCVLLLTILTLALLQIRFLQRRRRP